MRNLNLDLNSLRAQKAQKAHKAHHLLQDIFRMKLHACIIS